MTIEISVWDAPLFFPDRERKWIRGTYTDNGGNGPHGIKLDTGRWLSVQPNGTYEERDNVAGPYEVFDLDTTANLVRVHPKDVTYVIAVSQ
jgi:hypothetical protein